MNNSKPRRVFSAEFKEQAVELALISGNIIETARELGIDHSCLRRWVQSFKQE